MPIVPMTELLEDAERHRYAVGCYNAISLEMIRGVLFGAERVSAPVILCHAQLHFGMIPVESISAALVDLAHRSPLPVAILLDHGENLEAVARTIDLGFNAVMIDGSKLEFDENVSLTRAACECAHRRAVSVEGELGRVTRPRGAGAMGDDDDDAAARTELYTDVDRAAEFAAATGVDALAAAFGTAHGVYRKEPKLDYSRIAALREATGVPIVMHGGSGLSADQFRAAVKYGVRKINYYSAMSLRAVARIRETIRAVDTDEQVLLHHLVAPVIDEVSASVAETSRLFGAAGRA